MTELQAKFEKKFNPIHNKVVTAVYYELLDLRYLQDKKEDRSQGYEWTYSEFGDIHSVPSAVILEIDSNQYFKITWDSEFFHYGITIKPIQGLTNNESLKSINVSEEEGIDRIIGKNINSITVDWSYIFTPAQNFLESLKRLLNKEKFENRIDYPQTIILYFNDFEIFISAAEIIDGKIYGFADNLLIAFDKKTAEKYKLLEKGNS